MVNNKKIKPSGWLWTKPGQPSFVTQVPPYEWDPMWENSGYRIETMGPQVFAPYKAILIDPYKKVVSECEFGFDKPCHRYILEAIEPMYGNSGMFDAVYIDSENVMYVDDNGIAARSPQFLFTPYPQWLHGKALILGYDDEGDSTDHSCDINEIRSKVKFR